MYRVLVGLLLIAGIGAGIWWMARPQLPDPPQIEALGSMDPDVAALLREVRGARPAVS